MTLIITNGQAGAKKEGEGAAMAEPKGRGRGPNMNAMPVSNQS